MFQPRAFGTAALAILAAVVTVAVAVAVAVAGVAAASDVPASSPEGEALLRKVYERNATVKTLQAPFTQVKESALFASSLVTTGKIAFVRPGKLRWEVVSKPRSVLVVNGDFVMVLYPDLGKSEKFDRGRDPTLAALFDQLFVWLGAADPVKVLRDYRVHKGTGPATLAFAPLREPIKAALDRVTVTFDATTLVVRLVHVLETTGDSTTITFGAPVLDAPIDEASFSVK